MNTDHALKTDTFIADVQAELARARAKFPAPNLNFVALIEEIGELAKAHLEEGPEELYKEAVQVAVMAARVATEGMGIQREPGGEKLDQDER